MRFERAVLWAGLRQVASFVATPHRVWTRLRGFHCGRLRNSRSATDQFYVAVEYGIAFEERSLPAHIGSA